MSGAGKLGSRGASVCVALVMVAAACAEGCAHEQAARKDPFAELTQPSLAELELWAWPNAGDGGDEDAWYPLGEHQLVALAQLVELLIEQADSGRLGPGKRRHAAALAALVGVELRRLEVEIDKGRTLELWLVREPDNDRRGRGTYLIRVGQLAPAGRVELLLQAPHSRFDKRTGHIALRMLLENESSAARAVFINSAHRYRQLDGTRERREPASANPADAAHNPEHPIARVTERLLGKRELRIVQLHGFSRSAAAGDPHIIISPGGSTPSPASEAMLGRLRAALPDHSAGHFGVDTDRLGALQNVQGHAARAAGRCFVHVELSDELRASLLEDRELRRRFAAAVFDGAAEEFRGGCR